MITPDDVFEVLEEDVKAADLILWVGISFEQSASTAYFRRVRSYLQARPGRARRRRDLGSIAAGAVMFDACPAGTVLQLSSKHGLEAFLPSGTRTCQRACTLSQRIVPLCMRGAPMRRSFGCTAAALHVIKGQVPASANSDMLRAQEAGRQAACTQAVVNVSDEALWNLLSACSNTGAEALTLPLASLAGRPPARQTHSPAMDMCHWC